MKKYLFSRTTFKIKIILISFILFSHCNNAVNDCGFVKRMLSKKFKESEWKKCDNESLNYSMKYEDMNCLSDREAMLCSLIKTFVNKSDLKTIEEKLGKSITHTRYHPYKKQVYTTISYPVGYCIDDMRPNCLVFYVDTNNIIVDYEYIKR